MSKSDPTILLKQLKVRPKNKSVNKKKSIMSVSGIQEFN